VKSMDVRRRIYVYGHSFVLGKENGHSFVLDPRWERDIGKETLGKGEWEETLEKSTSNNIYSWNNTQVGGDQSGVHVALTMHSVTLVTSQEGEQSGVHVALTMHSVTLVTSQGGEQSG
jgi:hypothetical protein